MLNLPKDELPREKLIEKGADSLSNSELISLILGFGCKKNNVLKLSRKLIRKYNLKELCNMDVHELMKILGIGKAKACRLIACFELAKRLTIKKIKNKTIENPNDVVNLLFPKLFGNKKEKLICLLLNSRMGLISKSVVSIGTLDSSVIHPREIFKEAITKSAAGIILVHNHPSGDSTPSEEDIEITKNLIKAGKILGIKLVDHVIISDNGYFSFKENNLLFD